MKYRERLIAASNMMVLLVDQCNYDCADAEFQASEKYSVSGEDLLAEYDARFND